jgi:fatty aldehyde decarbonylase
MEQRTSQAIAVEQGPSEEAAAATGGQRPLDERHDNQYFDLLSYIVSNAVAGEIMAIENYSEMVQLMPTVESKIEAVTQANEECKHILLLSKLGKNLDFNVERRIVEPQWDNIRKHFSAAVGKSDLAACLIIQDLMTETMAILLYKTLSAESDTDPQTAAIAANILVDELEHLGIGTKRIRAMLEERPEEVHDSLVWAHHRVMPELFGMISTSCYFLCDELQLDCGSLRLSSIRTDIESLKMQALELYIDTLDAVGFDTAVTNPLIASMSAYEGMSRMVVGLKGGEAGACCPPQGATEQGRCC